MEILFIQTGGTIDKDYPRVHKGYAFEIKKPAVKRILKKINPSFEYEILPLLQKDSQEITDKERKLIVKTCADAKQKYIVITHGTDTMAATAKALKGIKNKVIVITGALRPERFSNSDAAFNLGTAVGALSALPNGIYIAMSGRVLPWNQVKKNPQTGQFLEANYINHVNLE
jgi:L-asparaginase